MTDAQVPTNYNGVGAINDAGFLHILPYILQSTYATGDNTDPSQQTAAAAGLNAEIPSGSVSINDYLNTYFTQPSTLNIPFPMTWDQFITTFRQANQLPAGDPNSGPAFNGFLTEFETVLKLPGDLAGTGIDTSDAGLQNLFLEAFGEFLQSYPYPSGRSFGQPFPANPSAPTGVTKFIQEWHDYLTRLALVATQFQTVYNAYFPGDTQANFNTRLQAFFKQQTTDRGFFVPSQSYGDWLKFIQSQYTISVSGSGNSIDTTIGTASDSDKVAVINRILAILILLINTVQSVASVQAQRLSFLTQWQKAYSDLLTQVRAFTKNGPEGLTDDDIINNRLNRADQQYTSSLQARQQVVSDDAKALQSTVTNSQNAVQQQGDTITSFIQQLSSILQTIYK